MPVGCIAVEYDLGTAASDMIEKRPIGVRADNSLLKAMLALVSAAAVGPLLLLIAMPVLTRLYSPDEFGLLANFNALTVAVLAISSLRYETVIPVPRSDRRAAVVLAAALGINLLTAAISLLIVALLGRQIADWFHAPGLYSLLFILPAVIACGGTYKALSFWAVRRHAFGDLARTRVTQSSGNIAVQVLGGLLGWSVYGLALGQFFGYGFGVMRLARGLSFVRLVKLFFDNRNFTRGALSAFSRFPRIDAPATLIEVISTQCPNLLLSALFGPAVGGLYLLCDRALNYPLQLISQSISQVLLAQGREGRKAFERSIERVSLALVALMTLPTIVLFAFGEPLFTLTFGYRWVGAGTFAGLLVFGSAARMVLASISPALIVTGGQKVNLVINIMLLLAKIAALLVGLVFQSPLLAIGCVSLAEFIGCAIGSLVAIYRVRASASRIENSHS
jgi:O-antigen/teichoic acid export membrane protein